MQLLETKRKTNNGRWQLVMETNLNFQNLNKFIKIFVENDTVVIIFKKLDINFKKKTDLSFFQNCWHSLKWIKLHGGYTATTFIRPTC